MSQLVDRPLLALKAGLAAALAWGLGQLIGNPDGVSAAFVAVICTSPTVLSGVLRARDQLLGSAVGGLIAALATLLPLARGPALGLAVGGSVWAVFRLGLGHGYLIAAFTAIYMLLIPRGHPVHTLGVRIEAVVLGAVAAMAVNGVVSLLTYQSMFDRRVRIAVGAVARHLHELSGQSAVPPGAVLALFPLLAALQTELAEAGRELAWRPQGRLARRIEARAAQVRALTRIAHLARDAALLAEEAGGTWTPPEQQALAAVARRLHGEPGTLPDGLHASWQRLAAALQRFEGARQVAEVVPGR